MALLRLIILSLQAHSRTWWTVLAIEIPCDLNELAPTSGHVPVQASSKKQAIRRDSCAWKCCSRCSGPLALLRVGRNFLALWRGADHKLIHRSAQSSALPRAPSPWNGAIRLPLVIRVEAYTGSIWTWVLRGGMKALQICCSLFSLTFCLGKEGRILKPGTHGTAKTHPASWGFH